MNTQRIMINYLKKSLDIERKKVQNLREQLELEQTSCKIERLLFKEDIEKYKKIAEDISREYMLYVQNHPDDSSEEDSDTDEDSEEESDTDEDSEDEPIDMSCFFDPPILQFGDPDTDE
jgi:hypothetical protein